MVVIDQGVILEPVEAARVRQGFQNGRGFHKLVRIMLSGRQSRAVAAGLGSGGGCTERGRLWTTCHTGKGSWHA